MREPHEGIRIEDQKIATAKIQRKSTEIKWKFDEECGAGDGIFSAIKCSESEQTDENREGDKHT